MSEGIDPGAVFVVGLRCRLLEPMALYRIEASIQAKLFDATIYEQHVELFATWADAAIWLTGLLSSTAATTTVADHLLSLRSE